MADAHLPGLAARRRRANPLELAATDPVAVVALDAPGPHLDTTFDYLVPAQFADSARPGVRVRVRLQGKLVDGFVIERRASSQYAQVPLARVVDPEPVLTPATFRLLRAVADRYAGTFADVVRLAIPPRHASGQDAALPVAPPLPGPAASEWQRYSRGKELLRRLGAGWAARAVWTCLPGRFGPWPAICQAVATTLAAGKRAIVLVPSGRELDYLETALTQAGIGLGRGGYVRLDASDPVSSRYRAYVAALRGEAAVVIGTRAAIYAPLEELGLVVVWEDGADTYDEQRTPYPNAAVVAALRVSQVGAAAIFGSYSRSAACQQLVESGWAVAVAPERATTRTATARVSVLNSAALAREGPAAGAHLPSPVIAALRREGALGPVLVQVPRAGYLPSLACDTCFASARCARCHGPLERNETTLSCRWCGALAPTFTCALCGGHGVRAVAIGQAATAHQIGRTVRDIQIISSAAATSVKAWVPQAPSIVVATMGAEPYAPQGYRLAVLLDAAASVRRASIDAASEALSRWLTAAALVVPAPAGGQVMVVGDLPTQLANALVAWDPATFAAADLAERRELGFAPTVRMAYLQAEAPVMTQALAELAELPQLRVLGPVEVPAPDTLVSLTQRALVSVPLTHASALVDRLAALAKSRQRAGLRIRIDPKDLV